MINDIVYPTEKFIDYLTNNKIENTQENITEWMKKKQDDCNSYVLNKNID